MSEITFESISVGLFHPTDERIKTNPHGVTAGIKLDLETPFKADDQLAEVVSVILFGSIFTSNVVIRHPIIKEDMWIVPYAALASYGFNHEYQLAEAVKAALEDITPETDFNKILEIILARRYDQDGIRFKQAFGAILPMLYMQSHYGDPFSHKTKLQKMPGFPKSRQIIFPKRLPAFNWANPSSIQPPSGSDHIVVQIEEWEFTRPNKPVLHFYAGYNSDSDTLHYWIEQSDSESGDSTR